MKKLTTIGIVILLIIIVRMIDVLPWWSFCIPVLVVGMLLSARKWAHVNFGVGFLAGFLVWAGANMVFSAMYKGVALEKLGLLLTLPSFVVILVSGIIGGLLTGLSLYTGKVLIIRNQDGVPQAASPEGSSVR